MKYSTTMLQEVDFWGNVLTTKFALEHLRRTRGQVVVTCSVGALAPYPKQTFYNVSSIIVVVGAAGKMHTQRALEV